MMPSILFASFLLCMTLGAGFWNLASERARQRNEDASHCRHCRYDLRAREQTNSICPECGIDQDDPAHVPADHLGGWMRVIAFLFLVGAFLSAIPLVIFVIYTLWEGLVITP